MPLLETYGASAGMTLDKLQTWARQMEEISFATSVSIKVNRTSKLTLLTVDLEKALPPEPLQAKLGQFLHLPQAITGQAYISNQVMNITIHR